MSGLTIDDFERLPQPLAHYHELVDGELVDVSGNTAEHNLFRGYLSGELGSFVRQHHLGLVMCEMDFDFGGNAHGPDVSFIGEPKVALIERKLRVQRFVPDVAIEIVPSKDTFEGVIGKALRYRRCGTREVDLRSRKPGGFPVFGKPPRRPA